MPKEIAVRAITPIEDIELMDEGGRIHSIETNIKLGNMRIAAEFLEIGKWFAFAIEHNAWDHHNYDTFAQWALQPEIGYGKSVAYGLSSVYINYVQNWNVDKKLLLEAGPTKLNLMLEKDVVNENNVIDMVVMAGNLSKRDLMHEIGVINLNEAGYIEAQLKKDDAGIFLHIHSGDEITAPGMYRLTEMDRTLGDDKVICHFKGKVQDN